MSDKKDIKSCFICHKTFDPKKDSDQFLEAEGKVACKAHHGVTTWYKKASTKVEEKATVQ